MAYTHTDLTPRPCDPVSFAWRTPNTNGATIPWFDGAWRHILRTSKVGDRCAAHVTLSNGQTVVVRKRADAPAGKWPPLRLVPAPMPDVMGFVEALLPSGRIG